MKANNVTTITTQYKNAVVSTTSDKFGVIKATMESPNFPTVTLEPSIVMGEECMAVTVSGASTFKYVPTANVPKFVRGVACAAEGYEVEVALVLMDALNDGHVFYDFELDADDLVEIIQFVQFATM